MTIKYTDEQKVRIRGMVKAFEGCRAHLAKSVRRNSGICYALSLWLYESTYQSPDWLRKRDGYDDAKALIERAIGPGYLEDWQTRGRVVYLRKEAVRHQWLDKLITDCKAALEE